MSKKASTSLIPVFLISAFGTALVLWGVKAMYADEGSGLIAGLFLSLIWLLLWTALSRNVARERGSNVGLWGLIGFLLGPLGFILALAAIPKPQASVSHTEVSKASIPAREAKYCYGCGNRMHVADKFCPACGKKA